MLNVGRISRQVTRLHLSSPTQPQLVRTFSHLTRYVPSRPRSFAASPLRSIMSSRSATSQDSSAVPSQSHLAAKKGTTSASTTQPPSQQHGNFRLIARVDLDYAPGMFVEKWQSQVTGLTLLWANFDSPLLNCYMTLATEIFQDSGVPHTLEHLIFLGSELFPYKGVLDTLANRAFASGTNAWTANDHTAYTLTTAGSDGFLRMLPVYLDHVFNPTLTDAGFLTEVYHVNGNGEDAGVVFSEMQGRENSSGDLMELKNQRMLYPKSSAYRSETGGLMEALRVLKVDDIRSYHHNYYAPHNAALVICGPLDRVQLLDTLAPVEERLVAKGASHGPSGPRGWKRPFVETDSAIPPKIDGSKLEQPGLDPADPPANGAAPDTKRRRVFFEFPEKDESVGEVQVTWIGPQYNEWLEGEAINIMQKYLSDSPVSAIQKAFIERDDPLCTDVYMGGADKAGAATLYAYFTSVPTEQLDQLDGQLYTLFQSILKDGIDMERIAMIIKRDKLKLLSHLETRPADSFADVVITDFLYGSRDGADLTASLDDMRRYEQLEKYTADQWKRVLQKYFVDNPRLVVIGRPSAPLVDKLKADTKALQQKRRDELGEAGLKRLEEALQNARKENDKDIPPEILSRFTIPDASSINWIPVGTASNQPVPACSGNNSVVSDLDREVQAHVDADGETLPFFVQFDHVKSAFVTITLLFSTAEIPAQLRPYISLYLASFYSLPIEKQDGSGTKLTYEEVVKGLDEDTLDYDISLGGIAGFPEMICAEIKVDKANYAKAVSWLRDLVWGSEFAVDRLKVGTSKLLQSLPEQKRNGRVVASSLFQKLTYDEEASTNQANSIIRQVEALPKLSDSLNASPEQVVADFETIRSALFRPDNLRVSVAGDVLGLERPRSVWRDHFVLPGWEAKPTRPVAWSKDVLNALGRTPAKKGLITALPSVESSYAYFTAKGVRHYLDADTPALVTAIGVLNAMESFLWRYIRGAGLAYGASIRSAPDAQHIHFSLYRSPDAGKAFLEAGKVVRALVARELVIDETTLESAKSSLHFSVAESEGTVGSAAAESFVDAVVKQTGRNRGRLLLEQIRGVTRDEVYDVLERYVLPIFEAETSVAAVVAPPSKVDEIQAQLEKAGYEMERVALDLGKDESDAESESGSEGSASGSESE